MDAVEVVGVLVWPVAVLIIVLFFLISFRAPIKRLVEDLQSGKGKLGPSGIEFEFGRRQAEAAAALGAASESKGGEATAEGKAPDRDRPDEIASAVATVKLTALSRLADAQILWVDDNPSNNLHERRSLEAFGIRFTTSTSTADAVEKMRTKKYDVVISNMGRPDDLRAGYTLLKEKQKLGDTAPFIIYSGSGRQEHKTEALGKGAFGSTTSPQELFLLVLRAIQGD